MAQSRLSLQSLLETLQGSPNVYYQPPLNVRMSYPCIVYDIDSDYKAPADNLTYRHLFRYQITLISLDKENPVVSKFLDLSYCSFSRTYVADGLNHFVFDLYF